MEHRNGYARYFDNTSAGLVVGMKTDCAAHKNDY